MDKWQLEVKPRGKSHQLNLSIPRASIRGGEMQALEASAELQPDAFRLEARADLDTLHINLQASGERDTHWHLQLARLDLQGSEAIGNWALNHPWVIDQTDSGWQVVQACWLSGAASLCGQADFDGPGKTTAELRLQHLPLTFLQYLSPVPVRVEGLLDGNLQLVGTDAERQLKLDLNSESGTVLALGQKRIPEPLIYRQLAVQAQMQHGLLQSRASVALGDSGSASATADLDFTGSTPQLRSSVKLDVDSLQWLDAIIAQIDNARGGLQANLNLQGPLANPAFNLTATLTNAGFIVPQAGIEVTDVQMNIATATDNHMDITASGKSGGGSMQLKGSLDVPSLDNIHAQASVRGQNFELEDRSDFRLRVNPNLQVSLTPHELAITGDLAVPEARARVRGLTNGGVHPSADEVLVGKTENVREHMLQTRLDLQLNLGDKVEFQGFGLTTKLTGTLNIRQPPGEPLRTFGSIETQDGQLQAFGRTLSVQRGRMAFQGELDNPALDIDAEQKYQDYRVGIHLGGTALDPSTTLFSDPVMSQTDILAVLLTGHKLDSMSASQAPGLMDAVTQLGIVGGSAIAQRLEGAFGLSELGVRDDADNGQSVVAGTYLSPRLYVEWVRGLFEPSSSVQLEYKLSDQLRLKARSGASQSMDLIYEIDTK